MDTESKPTAVREDGWELGEKGVRINTCFCKAYSKVPSQWFFKKGFTLLLELDEGVVVQKTV